MNLCLICLRTDKLLKLANNTLEGFHDELCDISIATMTYTFYYCKECEYILSKFYKFKEKCVKALKLYLKWKTTKESKKQPVNMLYSLLQPSSLGIWTNSERIANFTLQDTDAQTCAELESKIDTDVKVKQEYDRIDDISNINKFADEIKNENISKNYPKPEEMDEATNDTDKEELLVNNIKEDNTLKIFRKDFRCISESDSESINSDAKYETEDSNETTIFTKSKKSRKTTEKQKENVKSKKYSRKNVLGQSGKKVTAKMKAYYDKAKRNDKIYESVFDIEYLTTQEMMLDEFEKRKTYDCYVKAEHKCDVCYQPFKSLKFLEYHTNKWHTERPGSVYCPICKIWSSKSSTHRLTHTMVFKCKLCSLITYHRLTMQNHFEWHRRKQYRCEECDYSCKSKSAYQTHMGKVHRRGVHVCGACGRGFRSPLGLTIHKNSSSRCTGLHAAGGVSCHQCDVTLPSQEVYEAHLSDVHKPKRRQEQVADSGTGLPVTRLGSGTAKSRKVRRTTPFQLTCRLCNTSGLLGWCQLQQHFKKQHPTEDMSLLYADKAKHLCDVCGTGFSQVYSLRDHMNIHTGAKPYGCDLCPKRFRSAYLRKEHRARHFPSTVPCTYCGKRFKSKGNLYCHIKTHTGEKDHKCDICGKGFIQRTNLNEHIRGVHYNIRRVKRGAGAEGGRANKSRNVSCVTGDDDLGVNSK